MKTPFTPLFLGSMLLTVSALAQPSARRPTTAGLQQLRQLVCHPQAAGHTSALARTAAAVRVPGKAMRYTWSGITNAWETPTAITYTYNSRGQVTQQVETDSASGWRTRQVLTTYNAAFNPTETREQYWNGSAWDDDTRRVQAYDAQQALAEDRSEYFNGSAWEITKGTRYQNTYNAANQLLAQVVQQYDALAHAYANTTRFLYAVPANGEWTVQTIQRWRANNWQDSLRLSNVQWHDFSKNQIASADIEKFDGSQWTTNLRLVGAYSSTSEVQIMQEISGPGTYENYARFTSAYDQKGTLLDTRIENWSSAGPGWEVVLWEHHIPTYDAAGDMRRRIDQLQFLLFTSGLENTTRFHFGNYQGIALAAQPHASQATMLAAYPNPSADGRFVLQTPASSGPAVVRVTDALGREVKQLTFATGLPAQAVLDLGPQPVGVYLAEVRSQGTVARARLEVR